MAKCYSLDLEELVHQHFDKKFYFCPGSYNWKLPEPSEMFVASGWEEAPLQILKGDLKGVMRRLDSYNLDDWHKHTRAISKAGDIQDKLRILKDPELLSEDWCKFYENAMSFNLIPSGILLTDSLNSVHLCETSGSFITSLNHYMKVHNSGIKWKWLATTLNPYRDGNPSSCNVGSFILQTTDHWTFGLDNTGNLMDINNMAYIAGRAAQMGDVLLVTANGSIDCPESSAEQESASSSLHYCEVVSAMHILARGGSLLLKMFTMYEQHSVCLMYLLCCAFSSLQVYKPATSNERDSEVYVVCLGYRGRDFMAPWLQVLRKHYGPKLSHRAMFPLESIRHDFVHQFLECTAMFHDALTKAIETNMRFYERGTTRGENVVIRQLKRMIKLRFMEVYKISKLSESQKVLSKSEAENDEAECWN